MYGVTVCGALFVLENKRCFVIVYYAQTRLQVQIERVAGDNLVDGAVLGDFAENGPHDDDVERVPSLSEVARRRRRSIVADDQHPTSSVRDGVASQPRLKDGSFALLRPRPRCPHACTGPDQKGDLQPAEKECPAITAAYNTKKTSLRTPRASLDMA